MAEAREIEMTESAFETLVTDEYETPQTCLLPMAA